jgi:hypothetical protein
MSPELVTLAERIRRVLPESRFKPVSPAEIQSILAEFPDVPHDYLAFLREIGFGTLGEWNFMLYSGLTAPADIFDIETARSFEGVVLFGDNFAGWSAGFDTRHDWRIVGIDSTDLQVEAQREQTFLGFVHARLSDMER